MQHPAEGHTRRQWLGLGGIGATLASLAAGTRFVTAENAPAVAQAGDVYQALGVTPIINARGTITVLGGSRTPQEVRRAMDAASEQYVHLDELAEAIGARLASLTGAEWGAVTSGCSAALTLATAACVAGADPDKLAALPNLATMQDEVIVPRHSRSAYDAAIRALGVRIVEVDTREAFSRALGPRTAMVMVVAGPEADRSELSLGVVCDLAATVGVPVLVDAAAEELRRPNPHLARGASLVAYSGGKCLRGPQCAGLLIGSEDLVRAAWMHSAPHHGFGRGFKVGREEMVGMLAAVEAWGRRDHAREQETWQAWLHTIADRLRDLPAVATTIQVPAPDVLSNRTATLSVSWDPVSIPLSGADVEEALYRGAPRIAVSGAGSFLPFPPETAPTISIVPYQLREGEAAIIAERLHAFFADPPRRATRSSDPPASVDGTWQVTLTFVRGQAEHVFSIAQDADRLSGRHVGSFAERDLTGQVTGRQVLIRTAYTQNGRRLNFEFTGTIDGRRMSGHVSLGEYGRATWVATRMT